MAALVIAGIAIWKYVLHNEFFDVTKESVIHIFLIYYIFSNLAFIALQTFIGRKEIAKVEVPMAFETFVRVPLIKKWRRVISFLPYLSCSSR